MIMTTITVSERGQIVIPVEIRKELNIKEGEKLDVFKSGNNIIFVPIPKDIPKAMAKLGKNKAKISSVAEVRKMRLESERF